MGSKINIGLIGYGYWGPNLLRNFVNLDDTGEFYLSDLNNERLQLAKKKFPHINITKKAEDLIFNPRIDAILIATPVETHFKFAHQSIKAGKHVLIEKPLAASTKEAQQLAEMADKTNKVVMVDHTFVYTGAVRKIKKLIDSKTIGDPIYYDSMRVNLGLFQRDVNVIWDLAPHDVSIIEYLFNSKVREISATGIPYKNSFYESIAFIYIFFEDGIIGHINVSWISPVKIRLTLIGGEKKMIVYDDTEVIEKIKIYDRSAEKIETKDDLYRTWWQYRTGDIIIPNIDTTEALAVEAKHFLDCVINSKNPITDVIAGLNVVKILEAATIACREKRTMKLKGENWI